MNLIKLSAAGLFICTILCVSNIYAQNSIVEGYVYAEENQGYIANADIIVKRKRTGEKVTVGKTDKKGHFAIEVPKSKEYLLAVSKRMYHDTEEHVTTVGLKEGEKAFVKIEMKRKPGYMFEVTLTENGKDGGYPVEGILGSRIDVYNNTTDTEELVLNDFPYPTFTFGFEKGNHYTIMVRKEGYLNKRIEAYVNVEGCILCFDGLGKIEPKVTDVMSHGHETGTFLASIGMEPIAVNKTWEIENIYYDFDKWNIRQDASVELDGLITVLKDNPGVTVELGSHTDSRGKDAYNMELSEKRAQSAVEYILESGVIDATQITAKGYGETQLVNGCSNGVPCDEEKHQDNRRTELKILGIAKKDPLAEKSLKEIITEERILEEIMNQKPVTEEEMERIKEEERKQ